MHALTSCNQLVFEDAKLDEHICTITQDKPIAHFLLTPLDSLLGGIYPGQMVGIGAIPGCGKTSLMIQAADELAQQGQVIIFVSAELPQHKLVTKSLVRFSSGSICLTDVPHASDDAIVAEHLNRAICVYRETVAPNLCITGSCTVADLGRLVAECISQRNLTPIIFIDYLQLLATSGPDPFIDERLAIAAYVKQLRDLANTYMTPIFLISTINRGSYSKKKPDLSAFGGSAVIEYSLDAALFLSADDEHASARGVPVTLSALKNRYGTQSCVSLLFDAAHATFLAGD